MRFRIVFDQAKRDRAFEQRGLAFEDGETEFEGETFDFEDARRSYSERRFICVGHLAKRMVVVIWTPIDSETRRVISMRKANAREKRLFGPHFEE